MNILLIGAGGREHTLAWKLTQSSQCEKLFIAPGNAGTARLGTNLEIDITNFEKLADACIQEDIKLVFVGPEEPLVKGIVDYFNKNEKTKHIHIIGPTARSAALEGSKSFAKDFMKKHNIPTAAYQEFTADNFKEGVDYIQQHSLPVVLKADGLAAGKGVMICQSYLEAQAEFDLMILRSKFGEAGKRVVIEDFLSGIEMSVFVLTDGISYVMLPEAKDYKRIGEGDTGLNTGGMGAVSPLPFFDAILEKKVIEKIIEPTIKGLQQDNMDYKGFLFIGLMIKENEPFVIEYNCRLGDPETEVVIPRLTNDLVNMLLLTAQSRVNEIEIEIDARSAVAIVAVSGGYPAEYKKGKSIQGLDISLDECMLFHAGTEVKDDEIVSNSGRVFVSVAFGSDIKDASELADYQMQQVYFEDMKYRRDIGYEFIKENIFPK
ncbi:MAG: phosphoribosylamine--glycine ligase [Ferruginibacter sp.]